MEFERAKLEIEEQVAILTLNHPEVMNAVSSEMLSGLMKALNHVEDPKNGVRCLLMTGPAEDSALVQTSSHRARAENCQTTRDRSWKRDITHFCAGCASFRSHLSRR